MIKKKRYTSLILSLILLMMLSNSSTIFLANAPFLGAYNTVWCPNPSWLGGLNTRITFGRFFSFQSIFLQNMTFYATYNGTTYYLNVTSGNDVNINLQNWFDPLGTCFNVDRACSITLYVAGKGNPSNVWGASSVYHAGNQTLDLTVTGASSVGVHWGSGGSVMLINPIQTWGHSWGSYKTAYGFGVASGYWQYSFSCRVYCQNGRSDIQTVILGLGDNVSLTYTEGSITITENDPNHWVQVADEWYPRYEPLQWVSYDDDRQYLDVGFNIRFIQVAGNESIPEYWLSKYEPRMENQNASVTVNSVIEGSIINDQPAVFYLTVSQLAFVQPVEIYWNLSYLVLGLGAMFLMIFAPMYMVYRIKHGDIPEGLMWGFVLFLIAIGLLVVWLFR